MLIWTERATLFTTASSLFLLSASQPNMLLILHEQPRRGRRMSETKVFSARLRNVIGAVERRRLLQAEQCGVENVVRRL
jgi:hypothetical protein